MLLLTAEWAHSCSCLSLGTLPENADTRQIVFLGKADGTIVDHLEPYRNKGSTHFKIIESFKGLDGNDVTVTHGVNGSACGMTFNAGEVYFVTAHRFEGKIGTGLCLNHSTYDPRQLMHYYRTGVDSTMVALCRDHIAGAYKTFPADKVSENLNEACAPLKRLYDEIYADDLTRQKRDLSVFATKP